MQAVIFDILVNVGSVWGWQLYRDFEFEEMGREELKNWYRKLTFFFYIIFGLWTLAFFI